jgi:hypothetical protein
MGFLCCCLKALGPRLSCSTDLHNSAKGQLGVAEVATSSRTAAPDQTVICFSDVMIVLIIGIMLKFVILLFNCFLY